MSSTPSEAAVSLALELAQVLESIHEHFALTADSAGRLAAVDRDLGPARQHMADVWHIADATERVTAMLPDVEPPLGGPSARARFSDNICDVIFELAQTGRFDLQLDDIVDDERLAVEAQIDARLFGARRTGQAIR